MIDVKKNLLKIHKDYYRAKPPVDGLLLILRRLGYLGV
jgi:hypothetical protein